jgi:hypothetical protein
MEHMDEMEIHENTTLWSSAIITHAVFMSVNTLIILPIGVALAIKQSKLHKFWQSGLLLLFVLALIPIAATSSSHDENNEKSISGPFHIALASIFLVAFGFQGGIGWILKYLNSLYQNQQERQAKQAKTIHRRCFESIRTHKALKLTHRIVAGGMILLLPLILLFGLAHATNVAEEDADNYLAHMAFGFPLLFCGMLLQIPFFTQNIHKRLWIEYSIWIVFGVIIALSQHDWIGKGFSDLNGDMQHVLIGVLVFLCSACGMCFLISFEVGKTPPLLPKLPIATLYGLLSLMIGFHVQSNEYGVMLHRAFALSILVIAASHLFNNENDESSYNVQALSFMIAGVIFMGAGSANVQNVMAMFHPAMYLALLLMMVLIVFTWWRCILQLFSNAFDERAKMQQESKESTEMFLHHTLTNDSEQPTSIVDDIEDQI